MKLAISIDTTAFPLPTVSWRSLPQPEGSPNFQLNKHTVMVDNFILHNLTVLDKNQRHKAKKQSLLVIPLIAGELAPISTWFPLITRPLLPDEEKGCLHWSEFSSATVSVGTAIMKVTERVKGCLPLTNMRLLRELVHTIINIEGITICHLQATELGKPMEKPIPANQGRCSVRLRVWRPRNQKLQYLQVGGNGWEASFLIQVFNMRDAASPLWWAQICFVQPIDANAHLLWKHLPR